MLFHDIETDRLLLKCISHDDREFILREFSDPDVSRYLFDEEPYTCIEEADGLIEFFTTPEPRTQHRWILTLKETGEKIGTCGFHCWDTGTGYTEIGYDMQKAYWNKGYMTEALSAILDFAKNEMRVNQIDAHIYPENERSVALAKKFDFGLSPETLTLTFRGVDYPHGIYTLCYNTKPALS